jgi:hypothetical protein
MLKTFNVYVHRAGKSVHIGQVNERSEELARCAALSKFGISDDETIENFHPDDFIILAGDLFEVSAT